MTFCITVCDGIIAELEGNILRMSCGKVKIPLGWHHFKCKFTSNNMNLSAELLVVLL